MARPTFDSISTDLLREDRELLEKTRYPIVTISASFRDLIEEYHKVDDLIDQSEVVFSRAHFSMALGVATAAWGGKLDEKKAWLIDPSNYVTKNDWRTLASSQTAGRLLARIPILHWVKENIVDKYGRKKLPITDAITEPLVYLTQKIEHPIISMHIVAGNILAPMGKKVVQVVTDPHVRTDYVMNAHLKNITFCVFDEATKESFLQVAEAEGRKVDPKRVVVTGPPIDPRIIAARDKKTTTSWRRRPLRILLTTGGLGTNKDELAQLLKALLPLTRRRNHPVQIAYYAGTNHDHEQMVRQIAAQEKIKIGSENDKQAKLRLWYRDDIVQANELLLHYGFPWADLVYTKPSGDMAYDAAAAGCAIILLKPWGVWELNVGAVFEKLNIAQKIEIENPVRQLESILHDGDTPWLENALERSRLLPPLFLRGCANILSVARKM